MSLGTSVYLNGHMHAHLHTLLCQHGGRGGAGRSQCPNAAQGREQAVPHPACKFVTAENFSSYMFTKKPTF